MTIDEGGNIYIDLYKDQIEIKNSDSYADTKRK